MNFLSINILYHQVDDEEEVDGEEHSHKAYFKFQGGRYILTIPPY
jgi:hypothetical protein